MAEEKPVLFSSWRSSCSWRVRIALALKDVDYEYRAVSRTTPEILEELKRISPTNKVPVLRVNGQNLTESLAIIEFLEERYPSPSLLPRDSFLRAKARAIALQVSCEIQPLQGGQVLDYVDDISTLGREEWARHWLTKGLQNLEKALVETAGKYAVGDELSVADLFIPSILYKAQRHGVNLTSFPTLTRLDATLATLPAFKAAHALSQPDTPDEPYDNSKSHNGHRALHHSDERAPRHFYSPEDDIPRSTQSLPSEAFFSR